MVDVEHVPAVGLDGAVQRGHHDPEIGMPEVEADHGAHSGVDAERHGDGRPAPRTLPSSTSTRPVTSSATSVETVVVDRPVTRATSARLAPGWLCTAATTARRLRPRNDSRFPEVDATATG